MRYCEQCKQKVRPTKKFSWGWFLLGLLLFGIGAIIYLIYYFVIKKSNRCPMCGSKTKGWLWIRKHKEQIAAVDYGVGPLR